MKLSNLITAAAILISLAPLTGCRSYDGDGFANGRGYADQRLCVRRDSHGNEVWKSCPK